jgi:hypothetical protein
MTLRCLLFGHIRSRSRATFDEKRQRWISECRRCRIPMIRETDGTWHETAAPQVGKLAPVDSEADGSAPAGRSGGEAPLGATAAPHAAQGRRARAAKHKQKPVEFSTT